MGPPLPPLPPIQGELMLEVFTHKSLDSEQGAPTADEHGGSSRLATLGKRVLESVVMTTLFQRQPLYSATQLSVSRISTVAIVRATQVYCGRC